MSIIALALALFILSILLFFKHPQFGRLPSGTRLDRIKKSPNYRDGAFQNIQLTPALTGDTTYYALLKEFFFGKKERVTPTDKIPAVKTDLLTLDAAKDILVWFGHSSYFIQIDGKKILVDPVFSGSTSPLPFGNKAFAGSNNYSADDIPEIDFLFISHDHWDHLDYETLLKLKPKIKRIICGLGTGEHLERWDYDMRLVIEADWNEQVDLSDGFIVNTVPSRHFSGRGLARNKSLWLSFVLQTPTMKIFIGGDSGYDTHFAEIGKKFGPFDLAIVENGQYNTKWHYIHLLPEEVLLASKDLNARCVLPVHSAKFALALHPWDEPLSLISQNSEAANVKIITPMIGERVNLKEDSQKFTQWWKGIN